MNPGLLNLQPQDHPACLLALSPDERGIAVAYMICEPATHDDRAMTRSPRMPVLIEEKI